MNVLTASPLLSVYATLRYSPSFAPFRQATLQPILQRRILAVAALGLATMCANALPATAQNAFQGSITLPNDVRWNNAVLPAGDYTFTLESTALPARMILKGPNGRIFIYAMALSDRNTNQHSALTIDRRGSARFVRELYLANSGRHTFYWEPKIPKEELLAQGPATT